MFRQIVKQKPTTFSEDLWCLQHQGNKHLSIAGQFLPNRTAQCPKTQDIFIIVAVRTLNLT